MQRRPDEASAKPFLRGRLFAGAAALALLAIGAPAGFAADAEYVLKNISPEERGHAESFAAGVNRWLETGERSVFVRGNTGQAVRASSAVPGVFEPVRIGERSFVDGGVVSPVPVDAARQLGADYVIAVDISSKASGTTPTHLLGVVNQSIAIMGQTLGKQELARADVVIRPAVNDIGPADFEQRNAAILAGERAALAALPQIRKDLAAERARRVAALAPKPVPKAPEPECEKSWVGAINPFGKDCADD